MEDQLIREGEFEYVEKGEGPVIILLHGLFGALSNFEDVINHFSEKYKVVIPMMPLYTLPIINTNVKSLSKFIHKFIEHKGYDKVNLLGNSLGGHVALVYMTKHPERVRSMILTGSSGLYENAMGGSFPRKGDKEYIKKKVEVTFYDPKHATDELVDECFDIVNDKNRLIRILSLAKSAIRHNMANDLHKMDVPSCLIWGKNDTITPPEVAQEFQDKLPQADLFWIDECGHAPMMEHPKEFNKILQKWLDKTFGDAD
ncbi:alpha/beta hydrolase [Salibacter sp.]|uniref:alpha/beta fold hydrolase n=1 Tax=Salibacter sp. TaxID=2010995 RepID=UPI00287009B1|nr:alpha/beta hydrolase [Salibacter sp.]MDR9398341.1 alpha/beta hydrolase [Salibacter sp.]MDR9487585.1 alpha/beta hydrolase [Salibacter sp.]